VANLFERLGQRRLADNSQTEQLEPEKILRGPLLQPVVPPADRKAAPIERLLSWVINHYDGTTISVRDICWRGPRPIRDRASALAMAEALAAAGWLAPIKPHRHDRRVWRIAGR
jgi:hypothetical protein